MVLRGEYVPGMEVQGGHALVVDPRKTYAIPLPVSPLLLTASDYHSGFWEEHPLVSIHLSSFVMFAHEELTQPTSSAIIRDIMALQDAGQAIVAYFYFDFKDTNKQDLRDVLRSLLTQLSIRSDSYCDILFHVHQVHNNGPDKLSTKAMISCLKEMLALPDQGPIYIVLDALDECPNSSGIPSPREDVLDFLKDLVSLQLSDLHICVSSRPEIDIRAALDPLAFLPLSIHDQEGQKKDIENYIRYFVYSDSSTTMKSWRDQDKELVIDTLSEKADGM